MSRDILTLYEARVRKFDQSTGVATVVMPGPYGMEPIEAPPFARGIFDPYTIEPLVVGDRVLVTMSDNQPPEWISGNADWQAKGDDRWVNKWGDRMGGTLEIVAGIESLRLGRFGQTTPHMGFYNDDFTTRYAYIMGTPTALSLVSTGGIISIPPPNVLDFGAATRQMLNLYGTTYGIGVQGSTLYLRTASIFNIYRGGVHSSTANDPGAGGVLRFTIRDDGVIEGFSRIQGVMRPQTGSAVWGNGSAYIACYDAATDPDSLGTRAAYMGLSGNTMYLNNEGGTNTAIFSGSGVILLYQNVTEVSRVEAGGQAWGRTIAQYATQAGVDVRVDGRFICTMNNTNAYNWMINIGAADVAGGIFLSLRRTTTPAQIGSITQVATTGVAFNQTSHGPWKGNVQDLDDDEALRRLASWRPVAFQWKFDENGIQDEEGTPSGDFEHGFIAQELYEVQPNAVARGFGVQTEEKVWLERKLNHEAAQAEAQQHHDEWSELEPDIRGAEPPLLADFAEDDPFMPWGQDNSKLVPDMVAAMQAILRRVEAQDDEIAALRDEVAELRSAPGAEGR